MEDPGIVHIGEDLSEGDRIDGGEVGQVPEGFAVAGQIRENRGQLVNLGLIETAGIIRFRMILVILVIIIGEVDVSLSEVDALDLKIGLIQGRIDDVRDAVIEQRRIVKRGQ